MIRRLIINIHISGLIFLVIIILFSCNSNAFGYSIRELYNSYIVLDEYLANRKMEHINTDLLAWRESDIIVSYIKMYKVTKNIKWLKKAHNLIEIALDNLDTKKTYQGWSTTVYSTALVKTQIGKNNLGEAKIIPDEEIIVDMAQASKITGYSYKVVFEDNYHYKVFKIDTNETIFSNTCPNIGEKIIDEKLNSKDHKWIHQQAKPDNNYYSVKTNNSLLKDQSFVTLKKNGNVVPYGKKGNTGWSFRKDGSLNIYMPINEKPSDYIYIIDYIVTAQVEGIPGSYLQVVGKPKKGDLFFIKTIAQEKLFQVLDDGMILYPILNFINIVFNDDIFLEDYLNQAKEWLELIQYKIVPKWDAYWYDEGYYVFPSSLKYKDPGVILPYNHFLTFGRCLLLLYQITDNENYFYKTKKIANYFKKNLLLDTDNRAYKWNYWAGVEKYEDISHANLDIGFVFDLYEKGIMFNYEDLRKFANTFLKLMWNGSLSNPEIGSRVNTSEVIEGARNNRVQEWVRLSKIDNRIYYICNNLIKKARKGDENLSMHLIANLIELLKEGGNQFNEDEYTY